jgi:hypothetical protein
MRLAEPSASICRERFRWAHTARNDEQIGRQEDKEVQTTLVDSANQSGKFDLLNFPHGRGEHT